MKNYSLNSNGQICIDDIPQFNEGTYLCGTPYKKPKKATKKDIKTANKIQNNKFPHTVRNFTYNGFMGELLDGFTNFKAKFIEWTEDPGVFKAACSDGKERFLVTFAINCDFMLPPQTKKNVIFGCPIKK